MKIVCILLLVICSSWALPPFEIDLDPNVNLNEHEFEQMFNQEYMENIDKEEYEKRSKALKKNEEDVRKENEEFLEGKKDWFSRINSFDDLPDDEFVQDLTGAIEPEGWGRGLLDPLPEDRVDPESERYFDQFRTSRASPPRSFSSVQNGDVSGVRHQGLCGSCVAFASMAAIETCFHRVTGVFGDYAEQQFVDGAYRYDGANGCNGAPQHSYLKWAAKKNPLKDQGSGLPHENQRPYKNTEPSLGQMSYKTYNQGAKITDVYYTYNADEALLKKQVYENGAAVSTVCATPAFKEYGGGIFAGCAENCQQNHAITVVGYGNSGGQNYWLIKNSWGEDWGENGFMRLERDTGMCGIGEHLAVTKCGSNGSTSTDPPQTTARPCVDKYGNCNDLTAYCNDPYNPQIGKGCRKACGFC